MAESRALIRPVSRRGLFLAVAAGTVPLLARPARAYTWHNLDIAGYAPRLRFDMTDANTGKRVSAADFRGKFVLLYFGYTQCPDICPLALQNAEEVFRRMGPAADDFRFLFVTIDPNRDTLPVLKQYVAAFSPNFVGLRGDENEIARLARRYRIGYSVTPATKTHPYEVTHSPAIYAFGRDGEPKLLLSSLGTDTPDIAGTAEDLMHLLHPPKPGLLSRLLAVF